MRILKVIVLSLIVFAGIGAFAGRSWAQTVITVNNPSFENGFSAGCATGWTCNNNGNGGTFSVFDPPSPDTTFGSLASTTFSPSEPAGSNGIVPDGSYDVYLTSAGGFTNEPLDIGQTLTTDVTNGTMYTLTAWVDLRANGNGYFGENNDSATIELLAGGTVVGTDTISSPTPGQWTEVTINYTGTAGTNGMALGIDLGDGGQNSGAQLHFDDVQLLNDTVVTPETNTILLFGTGLLLIGGILRRKRTVKQSDTVAQI